MNYDEIIAEKDSIIAKYEQELVSLSHQLEQLRKIIFGRKSERHVTLPYQGPNLFSHIEDPSLGEDPKELESDETVTYTKKKNSTHKGRQLMDNLPAGIPVEEQVIEPKDKPESAVLFGKEISSKLGYKPGKFFIKQTIRPKYVEQRTGEIFIAPKPSEAIEKCEADTSLVSHIIVSKFVDHTPENRQIKIFKRDGVEIPPSSMNGWTHSVADLITCVVTSVKKQILASDYIQMDESTIKVLKTKSQSLGYMWVINDPKSRMCFFEYHPTRASEVPIECLTNYKGKLQTDAYEAYQIVAAINKYIDHYGCLAHARRKFVEAETNDKKRSDWMVIKLKKLYAIESICKERNYDAIQRKSIRKEEAIPILNEIKAWLDEQIALVAPRSPIAKAIGYMLNHWNRLEKYAQTGDVEIDNNWVENAIRPLALGRKNYLFAGSPKAAENIAKFYTLFNSCSALDLNPKEYLKWLLDNLPDAKVNQAENYTPLAYKKLIQQNSAPDYR